MALDPRFQAIIAAAAAAAPVVSPKGAAVSGALSALIQAAADFQANVHAGSVTDADLELMVIKAEANLAGLAADIAMSKGQA